MYKNNYRFRLSDDVGPHIHSELYSPDFYPGLVRLCGLRSLKWLLGRHKRMLITAKYFTGITLLLENSVHLIRTFFYFVFAWKQCLGRSYLDRF